MYVWGAVAQNMSTVIGQNHLLLVHLVSNGTRSMHPLAGNLCCTLVAVCPADQLES